MGCGASVGENPAKKEDMQEMCDVAAKDMEILCVSHAMSGITEGSLKLVVRLPDCVDSWKKTVGELRKQAEEIEAAGDEGGGDKGAMVAGVMATGGLLGGVAAAVGGAVDTVIDKGMEYGGKALAVPVRGLASTIETCIQNLEEPFQQVGKDVVSKSYPKLLAAFSDFINNYKFANSVALIRGSEPYGPEEYSAVAQNGISQGLLNASVPAMVTAMLPVVEEEVKEHKTTMVWSKMLDCNKTACETLRKLIDKSGRKNLNTYVDKLEATTDMNEHITGEICLGLLKLMSQREANLRVDSHTVTATHSKQVKSFQLVFSGTVIKISHCRDFANNKKQP